MAFRLFITVITAFLLLSCNSRQDSQPSLSVLGIHSLYIEPGEISQVSVVRDIGGERTEWIVHSLDKEELRVNIQLALPNKKMWVAIGGSTSALASTFESDVISEYPYASISMPINKIGEHVLMETKDDRLSKQNKIILIAQ